MRPDFEDAKGDEDDRDDKGDKLKDDEDDEDDEDENDAASQDIRLASSLSSTHGATATYSLPGTQTLTSSSLTKRHTISELHVENIEFMSRTVPKLRPAVFTSAKILNNSKIALPQGEAGLTLDGSFLGTTTIKRRCFPGSHLLVGLGVDESIKIAYSKPVMKSASQGILVKEQVVSFSRHVLIQSARPGLVKLHVVEQIPTSDDERLRVTLVQPKGLKAVGDSVSPVANVLVRMKKGGEVVFEVDLKEGDSLSLNLNYEARFPMSDSIGETKGPQ